MRSSRGGRAQDAADAWIEGTRRRRGQDGGGQDAADAWTDGVPVRQNKRATTAPTALTSLPVDAGHDITADAWEEKSKGYRSDQIHCGGGARFGSRGVREIYAASPNGSQLGCDPAI